MLKVSEKQTRQYLCCSTHVSVSAAYFSTEITTPFFWESPLVAVEIIMSPGEKNCNSRWGYEKKRREIPGATEILCVDFLIIKKKKGEEKKKQTEGSGLKSWL